jgi:hypothetical protein
MVWARARPSARVRTGLPVAPSTRAGPGRILEAGFVTAPSQRENASVIYEPEGEALRASGCGRKTLPFAGKDDLRDTYPFGMFAVPRDEVLRLHASSGTTGKLTVVGQTAADVDLFARVNARCLAIAGAEPGMTLHNAYGYGLFTGGFGLHAGGERLGLVTMTATAPCGSGSRRRRGSRRRCHRAAPSAPA